MATRPRTPQVDVQLSGDLASAAASCQRWRDRGIDGLFTFEGPSDVFLPLAQAAVAGGVDLYTNVAIAFPRSPLHLAHLAWDLQRASGGRFALGLGTQVRGHIERRYGAQWSHPVDRLREIVEAVRAIHARWQHGTPLEFEGRFTTHTLMPPLFDPGPLASGPPPIWAGAVGPRMTRMVAGTADGLLVHPLLSERSLSEHTLPLLEEGARAAGRSSDDLALVANVICCLHEPGDDAGRRAALDAARITVAFYASTPAYRPILDVHGLGELQPRLRELTRQGRWDELSSHVDDDTATTFALVGSPEDVGEELHRRFGGRVDRVALMARHGEEEQYGELLATLRRSRIDETT